MIVTVLSPSWLRRTSSDLPHLQTAAL